MIKTSGFQVWPREIEEALATHPAVAEVGVAGTSDAVKGEVVHAWVVLRAGQAATEQDLRAYCRERLAAYKVPARVEFRDSLPKTMVGKVLRRALKDELERRSELHGRYDIPIALTVTPAASRPARSRAARSAAPGVSLCTQIVSRSILTIEPSTAVTALSFAIRIARDTTASASWMTAPGVFRDTSEPSAS